MIATGSLIGFALVFIVSTWLASVVAALCAASAARFLVSKGPAAEKRAAALALIAPPIVGTAVTLSLAGMSWLFAAGDHCRSHGHHLHLCLQHGGGWAGHVGPVVLVAALGALFVVRLARVIEALWQGRQRLRLVRGSSTALVGDGVYVTPSGRLFCFTAGARRPRIFISTALLERLSCEERDAMLEHERAHIANGDLWRSLVISVFALLNAPVLAFRLRQWWSDATERLCDRVAADSRGDDAIASALLAIARGTAAPVGMSFVPAPCSVPGRIASVFEQPRSGCEVAAALGWGGAAAIATITAASAAFAGPLHHAFETLLGLL